MEAINFMDIVLSEFRHYYPHYSKLLTPDAREFFADFALLYYDIETPCSDRYALIQSICLN